LNRKLTSGQIYREARRLHESGQLTGLRLRTTLARKYGARGSVERVYAIVHELTGRPARRRGAAPPEAEIAPARVSEGEAATLHAERDAAIARAELMSARYDADSARWLREIDALRTEIAAAGRPAFLIYNRDPRDVVRDLEADLAAARRRVRELEQRLERPPADRE
jgi:hypothetical protein